MEIDYVVDKQGNKFKIKTSVDYGAVLTTSIIPELKPIDSMCIAPDGFIFSKWRDPEYRNSTIIDNNRVLGFAEAVKNDLLLPRVDKIYGFIHPDNIASSKWVLSRGGYMEGNQVIDGVAYGKYFVPVDILLSAAERIKHNV